MSAKIDIADLIARLSFIQSTHGKHLEIVIDDADEGNYLDLCDISVDPKKGIVILASDYQHMRGRY